MQPDDNEVIVPVVSEEVHADALPVETGAVRVTKRVVGEDEVLEQQLRKERAEVKRVKVDRPVDGPQQPYRSGNTLIVPVMAQVLNVEKRWVVTEEIHITKFEQSETSRQTVTVAHEEAEVERLDESGETVDTIRPGPQKSKRSEAPLATAMAAAETTGRRKILNKTRSMFEPKRPKG